MRSEQEFLDLQAARARARFVQTTRLLVDEVLAPLRLRPFVQRRPWWSVGAAATTGFLCGLGLGRRGPENAGTPTRGRIHHVLATVGMRTRRLLRTTLGPLVMTALRGWSTPASPGVSPSTNGHEVPVAE